MKNKNILFILFRIGQIASAILIFRGAEPFWMILILVIALIYAALKNLQELKALSPFGGYANWLTLLRGILLIYLFQDTTIRPILIIAVIGLMISVFDFFDGFLARKFKTVTKMGGILDEEMDTLYFIVFGYILFENKFCNTYILIPGIAKYAKDLLIALAPSLFLKPVKMPVAKWIAGISFILFLTPFILSPNIYSFFTITSVLALCLSLLAEVLIRFSGFSKNKAFV
jgi:hypothetical protein